MMELGLNPYSCESGALLMGWLEKRRVPSILSMRVKRKQVASLASVPFVEMCMCGAYCFIKSFCINLFYPPPDTLWKKKQVHRILSALSQGTIMAGIRGWLEAKYPNQWSRPHFTKVHCSRRELLPPSWLSLFSSHHSMFLFSQVQHLPCGAVNKYNTSEKELQIFMAVITSHPKKAHGSDH